jgi:hypothetical protein
MRYSIFNTLVAKTSTLSLFPSLNEKLIWSLNDGLFEGSDLTY